ncbi:MAG TPA: D-alanyl-lipoteichoic acid biosynthesis protein DltD [Clostridium sp.]|nr:D-alanyl-lipoteichoic acid biosynthesis protein DltD [Clostridium sp.]
MRKVVCVIIPFFVVLICLYFLNSFLDRNINIMLEKKGLNWASKEYESVYKDQGVRFNSYFADKDYVLLQATSELKVPITENPRSFFPVEGMNNVETVGVQGWQSITQAEILGSEVTENKNRKVALVVSPQWFYYKDGVPTENFQSSFAPVQFYSFLDNPRITEEHKRKYTLRMSELLTESVQYFPEKLYAKLYNRNDIISNTIGFVFKPYFFMRKNIVEFKDKGMLYKKLKLLSDKTEETDNNFRSVDWSKELISADEDAKKSITNNDYWVCDKFYDENKMELEKKKDYLSKYNILDSKEYDDYELYLDICNDLGIKPYIILLPTNGKWYDELGLNKNERDEFYKKARKVAADRGFEVVDYADKEYTPYFMYDASHFGWEGWLDVDKKIYEHFKN